MNKKAFSAPLILVTFILLIVALFAFVDGSQSTLTFGKTIWSPRVELSEDNTVFCVSGSSGEKYGAGLFPPANRPLQYDNIQVMVPEVTKAQCDAMGGELKEKAATQGTLADQTLYGCWTRVVGLFGEGRYEFDADRSFMSVTGDFPTFEGEPRMQGTYVYWQEGEKQYTQVEYERAKDKFQTGTFKYCGFNQQLFDLLNEPEPATDRYPTQYEKDADSTQEDSPGMQSPDELSWWQKFWAWITGVELVW